MWNVFAIVEDKEVFVASFGGSNEMYDGLPKLNDKFKELKATEWIFHTGDYNGNLRTDR